MSNGHSQKDQKLVFKTNFRLMQVKSIAECSEILLTFIKLPFVIKIFVLFIFEWQFYKGFTVQCNLFIAHLVIIEEPSGSVVECLT